jgi:hypothetical protein
MNIIELAKQAGFFIKDNEAYSPSNQEDHELTEFLERFAALVAAQEREECAKLCIQMANRCDDIRKAALEVAAENIIARRTT